MDTTNQTATGGITVELALLPERYAALGKGSCMEPIAKDGDTLVFDKNAAVEPGDIVLIWFDPECSPFMDTHATLKRLVGLPDERATVPVIVVEMLNPPQLVAYRAENVIAIHKCVEGAAEIASAIPTPLGKEGWLYTTEENEASRRSAKELAYLDVARAWVDRWKALGGHFSFVYHPNGQPKELLRGMPADLDDWTPSDADRQDLRFRITEPQHWTGAMLALEGMLEQTPGLLGAIREIGGREAFTRWAKGGEA